MASRGSATEHLQSQDISKTASSLFLKMIAKLDQRQNPKQGPKTEPLQTSGATIDKQ